MKIATREPRVFATEGHKSEAPEIEVQSPEIDWTMAPEEPPCSCGWYLGDDPILMAVHDAFLGVEGGFGLRLLAQSLTLILDEVGSEVGTLTDLANLHDFNDQGEVIELAEVLDRLLDAKRPPA